MPVTANNAIMSNDNIDSNYQKTSMQQNPGNTIISLPTLSTTGLAGLCGNANLISNALNADTNIRNNANATNEPNHENNANNGMSDARCDNPNDDNSSESMLTSIQQQVQTARDVAPNVAVSSINSQFSSANNQNNNHEIEYNFITSEAINKGSRENLLNSYYNGNAIGVDSQNRAHEGPETRNDYGEDPGDGLGPLPAKWETAFTERGELYFIDHNTGTSHWLDPRLSKFQKKSLEDCNEDELPYGWEKIEDSLYGTYYIDHVNRKTQYENPVLEAKRRAAEQKQKNINDPNLERPTTPSNESSIYAKTAGGSSSTASTIDIAHRNIQPPPVLQKSNKFILPYKFTRNPSEMGGERISTTLIKSPRGLGITIVGGENVNGVEEFLQIKSIVPNGPAWMDNKLQPGDILVYINNTCVLGFTHHEMVNIFQSILPGDAVTLKVCRGYPLPFDPNDPNTEVVTTIAVNGLPSSGIKPLMDLNKKDHFDNLFDNRENIEKYQASKDSSGFILMKKPDVFTLNIMKGTMGFGFTIADSAEGQNVKKILDRNCCAQLQEGDILLEINGVDMRYKTHNEVVQALKECSKTELTTVKIQRECELNNDKAIGNVGKLRKNFANQVGLYRSKTPTADLYSTQQKEILPMRPKTPLVDTRRPRVKTPSNELNEDHEVEATIRNGSVIEMERNLGKTQSQMEGKSQNSLHEIDVFNQDIPFMDPYPKLVSSLSERLASTKLHEPREMQYERDYQNDSNYSAIYGMSPFAPAIHTTNPINEKLNTVNSNYMLRHFNSMNPTAQNFSYQHCHQESCFCYSCQDGQYPKNYSLVVGKKASHNSIFNDRNEFSGAPFTSTNSSVQAAHFQNEQMEKRVHELLHDRRRVGFSSIESQFESQLKRAPQQQVSPAISSISQQPSVTWDNGLLNHSDVNRPNNGLLDVADIAHQYELNEVTLERQTLGFGFRIVGGTEEGSQVAVGHIVPGGAADNDHRINTGDEILSIDGVNVVNSSHHKVVSLMGDAAVRGKVTMIVRRRIPHAYLTQTIPSATNVINYPYDVVVSRNENEGFGFVIISSSNQYFGSTIGKLVAGSPADRCGTLKVGDRIVAVNRIEIAGMSHGDVVNLIKESGLHVRLTIGYPIKDFASGTASQDGTPTNVYASEDAEAKATVSHIATEISKPLASPNTLQGNNMFGTTNNHTSIHQQPQKL